VTCVDLDMPALVGEEHTTRAVCVLLAAAKKLLPSPM